jgi:glyoxylase-like metal-dependent hydrolase (beta-lactamase superfamily II)
MREIMKNVYRMESVPGCNVYLLVSGDNLALIDSGLSGGADAIISQIQAAGFPLPALRMIVLTHAHGDHTGNVAELIRRSGAKLLAHRTEVPFIERTASLPVTSPVQRLFTRLADLLLFRQPLVKVDRPLEDEERIDALGGLQVVPTPGHTPGSISLYQPDRRILFCGDALFNRNPVTGRKGIQFPLPMLSVDMNQARESVGRLAGLPVEICCFGHGEPILERAGEKIKALAENSGTVGGE